LLIAAFICVGYLEEMEKRGRKFLRESRKRVDECREYTVIFFVLILPCEV
jgi:hypothetical protein